jgi:hypothetical protein
MKLGIRLGVLVVLLAAVGLAQAQTADTAALMTQELALKKAVDAIKERRKDAVGALQSEQEKVSKELAAARSDTSLPEAEKAARVADLERQHNRIRDEVRARSKPFDDEIKAQIDKVGPSQALFDLIRKHVRELGPPYSVAPQEVTGIRADGFYACNWKDAQGKTQVWTHIRLENDTQGSNTAGMLDGKYPMSSLGKMSVWFKVGYFKIVVHVNNKDWHSPETVQSLAKAMFDLEGLAALKPQ